MEKYRNESGLSKLQSYKDKDTHRSTDSSISKFKSGSGNEDCLPSKVLLFRKIDPDVTEDELGDFCKEFGQVKHVDLRRGNYTAFVVMENLSAAQDIVHHFNCKTNFRKKLHGRAVHVNYSQKQVYKKVNVPKRSPEKEVDLIDFDAEVDSYAPLNPILELPGTYVQNELRPQLDPVDDFLQNVEAPNTSILLEIHSDCDESIDPLCPQFKFMTHKYDETLNDLDIFVANDSTLEAVDDSTNANSTVSDSEKMLLEFKMAETPVSALQERLDSIVLDNSNLTRSLYETKAEAKAAVLVMEKVQTETGCLSPEALELDKAEGMKLVLDKLDTELKKSTKDNEELLQKNLKLNELVKYLTRKLDNMQIELRETKVSNRFGIRALEFAFHQSVLDAEEARQEADLLRLNGLSLHMANDTEKLSGEKMTSKDQHPGHFNGDPELSPGGNENEKFNGRSRKKIRNKTSISGREGHGGPGSCKTT